MMREELSRAIHWIEKSLREISFGEVGIVLILHQGEIRRVEYHLVEKKLPVKPMLAGENKVSGKLNISKTIVDKEKEDTGLLNSREIAEVLRA
jgi:hypothetical protein